MKNEQYNLDQNELYNLEKLDLPKIEEVVERFATEYIPHERGFFIMAPSGVGKTYYVNHQRQKDWIDGDKLWVASGAHPNRAWWLESYDVMDEIDRRSDVVTSVAKERGLWIMGASNRDLVPDAIVIPDWEEHKRLIKLREENGYDGGATSDRLDQVKGHREWILKWADKGVPVFKTVQEAAETLANM